MGTAVIYARCSSSGAMQDRQDTTRQVLDLKEYAANNKLEVIKVFEEHISGAKKIEDRPVFSECLRFAKDEHIDLILFSELSRCGRSVVEVNKTINYLADNSINAYFQKENLFIMQNGKVNPITYVITSCLGMAAEFEKNAIAYRLNSGRRRAIENGTCTLGRKIGSVKSREKKASEYKEIIKLLRIGYSIRKVAKLTDFSVSTVQRVKSEFQAEINI